MVMKKLSVLLRCVQRHQRTNRFCGISSLPRARMNLADQPLIPYLTSARLKQPSVPTSTHSDFQVLHKVTAANSCAARTDCVTFSGNALMRDIQLPQILSLKPLDAKTLASFLDRMQDCW